MRLNSGLSGEPKSSRLSDGLFIRFAVRSPGDKTVRAYQYSVQTELFFRPARHILHLIAIFFGQRLKRYIYVEVKQHTLAILHQLADLDAIFEFEVRNAVAH